MALRAADPVWTKPLTSHAARRGAPLPPTIMAIATALPRLLMAAAAPAITWLPLNVAIVDNDRGALTEKKRAREKLFEAL